MKKIIASVFVIMFMVVASAGFAVAEDAIIGTIAEKGDIMVLDAADGTYVLEGSDMTPDMIGKKVKVTGTVVEKDDMRVISVLAMEEVME